MTSPPHPGPAETDRRNFLKACLRYPVLAGLIVLGGSLAARRASLDAPAPCVKQRVCHDCRLLTGCFLPQAAAHRQATS